jgi:homoserine kinase
VYLRISFEQQGNFVTQTPSLVSVFAPATVANVGSAFDVLGFALDSPGDTVVARRSSTPGIRITSITGDSGRLPLSVDRNTAGVSVLALLSDYRRRHPNEANELGIELSLTKGLPIGSGLGSSSASTVAAVVAANELLSHPLSRSELLPFAMEGERIACGAAHADNVAPSLLGGFVLIRSYDPLDVIALPSPQDAWIAVVSPELELKTVDARRVLKRSVPLDRAVAQWGNVAALVAGIYQNNIELIGRSLEDTIIEPERAQLIPGYYPAKSAALLAGALGCSISGSGPSVFAICRSQSDATVVAGVMGDAFRTAGLGSQHTVSQINTVGATVISKE